MKRLMLSAATLILLAVSAGACTPSDEKVCAHLKDIIKDKDMQDPARCAAQIAVMKAAKGDAWKTTAKCLMDATDEKTAEACIGK